MSVTTERVLEKSCKFGVAIRNVSCCMRFGTGRVSKRGYDISEGQKATVNRDTLFDALSRGSSPLKLEKNRYKYWKKTHGSITYSFRTRQIDEMEFGYDGNPFSGIIIMGDHRPVCRMPKSAGRAEAAATAHCSCEAWSRRTTKSWRSDSGAAGV